MKTGNRAVRRIVYRQHRLEQLETRQVFAVWGAVDRHDESFQLATDWSGGAIPDGSTAVASFPSHSSATRITLDKSVTLNQVSFSGAGSYSIEGSEPLAISGSGAAISANGGPHSLLSPLNISTDTTVSGNGSLNLGDLTIASAKTVTFSNQVTGGAVTGGSITVKNGGELTTGKLTAVNINLTRPDNISFPTLTLEEVTTDTDRRGQDDRVAQVNNLSIANDGASLGSRTYFGSIDITNNDLIVTGASFANIQDMIRAGWASMANSAAPQGIVSRTSIANGLDLAIGYLYNDADLDPSTTGDAPFLTSFDGIPLVGGEILIKTTFVGDANLDGIVDFADAAFIDAGLAPFTPATWCYGDFNYDGAVDSQDYDCYDLGYELTSDLGRVSNDKGPLDLAPIGYASQVVLPPALPTYSPIDLGIQLARHIDAGRPIDIQLDAYQPDIYPASSLYFYAAAPTALFDDVDLTVDETTGLLRVFAHPDAADNVYPIDVTVVNVMGERDVERFYLIVHAAPTSEAMFAASTQTAPTSLDIENAPADELPAWLMEKSPHLLQRIGEPGAPQTHFSLQPPPSDSAWSRAPMIASDEEENVESFQVGGLMSAEPLDPIENPLPPGHLWQTFTAGSQCDNNQCPVCPTCETDPEIWMGGVLISLAGAGDGASSPTADLGYAKGNATGSNIITASIASISGYTPDSISTQLTYAGRTFNTQYYATSVNGTSLTAAGGEMVFSTLLDDAAVWSGGSLASLDTGTFGFSLQVTALFGTTPYTATITGKHTWISSAPGAFGKDWNLFGLDNVVEETSTAGVTGLTLVAGGGGHLYFPKLSTGFLHAVADDLDRKVTALVDSSDVPIGYKIVDKFGRAEVFSADGLLEKVVDNLGNTTSYGYDSSSHKVIAITDQLGRATSFHYATSGRVDYSTDAAGRVTNYVYSSGGRITAVERPDATSATGTHPQTSTVTYLGNGLVDSITNPRGETTEFIYDAVKQVRRIVRADGTTEVFDSVNADMLPAAYGLGSSSNPMRVYAASRASAFDPFEELAHATLGSDSVYQHSVGRYIDGKGNVTARTGDNFENPLATLNNEGDYAEFERNAEGLATAQYIRVDNSTWRETSYSYTDRLQIEDVVLPDLSTLHYEYDATSGLPTLIQDELGRKTIATIAGGFVTEIRRDMGTSSTGDDSVWTYAYTSGATAQGQTPNGLPETVTDPTGSVNYFHYGSSGNALGRLDYTTSAYGTSDASTTSFTYDGTGHISSATVQRDATHSYTTDYLYDRLDRLISVEGPDPDGTGSLYRPVTTYQYCICGALKAITDPNQNVTVYLRDDRNRVVAIEQPSADGVNQPDPDNRTTTPDLGVTLTTMAYDKAGNLVRAADPLGRMTTYSYDRANRLVGTVAADPDGSGSLSAPSTRYTYNGAGELIAALDSLGNFTERNYNSRGWLDSFVSPNDSAQFEYDESGRVTSRFDSHSHEITFEYDDSARITTSTHIMPVSADDIVTTTAYNELGQFAQVADTSGHATTYEYDYQHRLKQVVDPNMHATVYNYYADGLLKTLTDSDGNSTDYDYYATGWLKTETDQLSKTREFSYDEAGRLTKRVDRLGRSIQFDYDHLDRMTSETWKSAANVTTGGYGYTYDRAGQLLDAYSADSETQFFYNGLGQVRVETGLNGAGVVQPDYVLRTAYDVAGRRLTVDQEIDGTRDFSNSYSYDSTSELLNGVTQAGQTGGNTVAAKHLSLEWYDPDHLSSVHMYSSATASTSSLVAYSNYNYDDALRLSNLTHSKGGGAEIRSFDYGWNPDDRLESASSSDSSGTEWSVAYGYDDRGQLTTADWTTVSGLSSLLVDETYNFTDNGNRSGSQTNGVGTKTYVNSTNNQTTADGRFTYIYDDEGNRSRKTDNGTGAYTEYAWDNRDRLVKVTEKTSLGATTRIVQEVYDAFDRWIGEKIDGNGDGDYLDSGDHARAFLYDGMKIVNQFDDGTQTHRYLQAMDMLFADEQLTGSAGTLWDLGDNLGSVRDVVNSSGAVVDHIVYDSYGRVVQSTSGAPDRLFGFTGQAFNKNINLQNNWHRWYDAEIGKWVSEDPIGFRGGDQNLTRYVTNSPNSATDALGLWEWPWSPDASWRPVGTTIIFGPEVPVTPMGPHSKPTPPSGFFGSAGRSLCSMPKTYASLILEYWYGLPDEAKALMEEAYETGPLGQTQHDNGVYYYGTRGALTVSTVAMAAYVLARGSELIPSCPKPSGPKPPDWNSNWTWEPGIRDNSGWHWWDAEGGEWRFHDLDQFHSTPHWDYNPWDHPFSPWQNLPL